LGGDDEDDDDATATEVGAVVTNPSLGVLRFLVGVVLMVGVATEEGHIHPLHFLVGVWILAKQSLSS
jgi:hypothetical protein